MEKMYTESSKVQSLDSTTVSAGVLADIFGVSERRVRQMAEEGIAVRAAKGRYRLIDSLKNYILTIKLAAEGSGIETAEGEIDLEEEKGLHERVKRHISELRLQIMKGEVHKAEDVELVMTDMLSAFKTRVMGIPAKTAPMLENRDAAYIKDRLAAEAAEVLNELKDYDPRLFYSGDYVEDEDEVGEE